jgi:hypothetical protein
MLFLGRYGLDQAVYAWCISGLMMFMLSAFFFSRVFKLSIREIFFPVRTSLLAVGIMMAVLVVVRIELYRLGWMPISVFVTVILLGGFVYLLASVLLNRRLVVDCITFMRKML